MSQIGAFGCCFGFLISYFCIFDIANVRAATDCALSASGSKVLGISLAVTQATYSSKSTLTALPRSSRQTLILRGVLILSAAPASPCSSSAALSAFRVRSDASSASRPNAPLPQTTSSGTNRINTASPAQTAASPLSTPRISAFHSALKPLRIACPPLFLSPIYVCGLPPVLCPHRDKALLRIRAH